ncbi:hypothetical protein VP01_49g2 [Puccinia sorghi]|uniref:Uncharacterized protein n=1 Tax=Puccinia sorghi TaxID=27349 RepID=A0A0L6UMH7_9BASI|nr:hypothetical protein VP01_49g2 [Puccinia sorghi]
MEGYHSQKQDSNHSRNSCWHLNSEKAPDWWHETQEKWKSNKDRNQVKYYCMSLGALAHIFNNKNFFSILELKDHNEQERSPCDGRIGASLSKSAYM